MPEKTKFRFKTFSGMERYFKALKPHPGPEKYITDELLTLIKEDSEGYTPQELWYFLCGEESEGTYSQENAPEKDPDNYFNAQHLELFQDKHLYK